MKNSSITMNDYVDVLEVSQDLKAAWKNFDVTRLVVIREKLIYLLDKSTKVAEEGMNDAINDLGTRKMLDAIASADKLLGMLDRLSGISARVSLETAIEEVSRAGYVISGAEETQKEPTRDVTKEVVTKIRSMFDETKGREKNTRNRRND